LTLETGFDATFTARLALREKQVQQRYRPIIGVHKWFARRPGTVFRNLLLAEFGDDESAEHGYWRAHDLRGVIADPFMGGGTPLFEANRLGFNVVGTDINPMAYWVVRQSLAALDLDLFATTADEVAREVEREVGEFYVTRCTCCGERASVKYFLWVKHVTCPLCGGGNDLFPGYLLAEATRHPKHVLVCGSCGALNEYDRQPSVADPEPCAACGDPVHLQGPARRNRIRCRHCTTEFAYPAKPPVGPPRHRLWAIEYHCKACKARHTGRFFKQPDADDLARVSTATEKFAEIADDLAIPDDSIPAGDETDRLHRWGYRHYREMFNERQLLGLGLLLRRIRQVADDATRHALLTVFSDFLRYQNLLCRYDTYALKCQDIFSVHGFPVGLIQCENNLLGIPKVGSGSFRHFVEKYRRAKEYCVAPFETRQEGARKLAVPIPGERIEAELIDRFPEDGRRQAWLRSTSATCIDLPPCSLDGVFTDPPYFDNVQYAELMDFCYVWLRQALSDDVPAFSPPSTRSPAELTGNTTLGRDLEHFTEGLSAVFRHFAAALKAGAPFVFTYHHNDPSAYVPLVVAILDAGLDCTATLPAPAEMGASLHIAGTDSSIVDSVFVCRNTPVPLMLEPAGAALDHDIAALQAAGVSATDGDRRCLFAGHVARLAINHLRPNWDVASPTSCKLEHARCALEHSVPIRLPESVHGPVAGVYDSRIGNIHDRRTQSRECV
jgi:hypothetical protein